MARRPGTSLTIDCGTCPVQHVGCADCMVTALYAPAAPVGGEGEEMPLDRREREVLSRLVASGLVAPETATGARAVREPRSRYDDLRSAAG